MGQKINPIIYRLGIENRDWGSKYFEKNKEEHTLYNYQNLQIQKYLKEYFGKKGLDIHDINLYYNQKTISIYISYFYTKKTLLLMKKESDHLNFKMKRHKFKKNRNLVSHKWLTKHSRKSEKISDFFMKKQENLSKLKIKRIKILSKFKLYSLKSKYNYNKFAKKNEFLQKILETLTKFTNNRFNIKLILQNLNKGLTINLGLSEKIQIKRKLLLLKQYSRKDFFHEGLKTIITVIKIRKSSILLANYINKNLKVLKKHNYFLIFLKKTLIHLINLKSSKVEGIKILINGRLNGAPRAKNKLIIVGDIPVQTIKKDIDYNQLTCYTKNGTFGIKIWISYI